MRQVVLHRREEKRADDRPQYRADPADQCHQHDLPRHRPIDIGQGGELKHERLCRPGEPRQGRRQDKGEQFVLLRAIAERNGARLVLADRLQHLAEGRIDRAHDNPEAKQEDREHEVVHHHRLVQVDDAEQIAARHRLNAVFAAGELRLQAEKEHHLCQGQGDHREIDALTTNRESAEDKAERGRDRNAGQDRQLGRQSPHFCGMRGDVGGAAKKRGVPERQQPGIAEQQIEGAGKERHA